MKSIILFLTIYLFSYSALIKAQGIIIDHHCTAIEQIPNSVIDDIQNNIKFQWAHTSHGRQIFCGLENLEASDPDLNVEIGTTGDGSILPEVPGALCIFDGVVGFDLPGECCNYITEQGYWYGTGPLWVATTFELYPALNVSGWIWCYQLETYGPEMVQIYLDQMEAFEDQYPGVTFIYTTGNAQAVGEAGYNRYLRSQQIREYCIANNKILYDFEDLDSWYNGEKATYLFNGTEVPVMHSAYNGDDCGHMNYLASEQKGRSIWWMMARIRGWEPGTSSLLDLKVYLQGNFTGSNMATTLNEKGLLPLNQPFGFYPINYFGTESVPSIPNPEIVDWILLEFRDAATASSATSSTTIGRKAAFLLNNGTIVDLDGSSNLPFEYTINQNLYLVLWHRNHLGIMSSDPLYENNNIYTYDFSTGLEKVFNGAGSYKELIPGKWGMVGGDWNTSGVISLMDKIKWKIVSGAQGYSSSDYNLNGSVDNQDKNDVWIGNNGKISSVPY